MRHPEASPEARLWGQLEWATGLWETLASAALNVLPGPPGACQAVRTGAVYRTGACVEGPEPDHAGAAKSLGRQATCPWRGRGPAARLPPACPAEAQGGLCPPMGPALWEPWAPGPGFHPPRPGDMSSERRDRRPRRPRARRGLRALPCLRAAAWGRPGRAPGPQLAQGLTLGHCSLSGGPGPIWG